MARIPFKQNLARPVEVSDFHPDDTGLLIPTDDAAVRLVVGDYNKAINWIQAKQWETIWREADILYQSPRSVSAWENSTVTRANVTRFTVAKHVNSIVPQLVNGLFFDEPPFKLIPRPGTKESITRSWEVIMSALLDLMEFRASVPRFLRSMALFGTGIAKWGEYSGTVVEKVYRRKQQPPTIDLPMGQKLQIPTQESDEYEITEIIKPCWHPYFDVCDHRLVKVDPAAKDGDIRSAKWVVYEDNLNYYDLEALRDDETYQLPSEEELKSFWEPPKELPYPPSPPLQSNSAPPIQTAQPPHYESSTDPLANPLQVLERVDEEGRIITVLQQKLCIRNTTNDLGSMNYLSANWWDIPNSFWGMGIGRIIGQDQRVDQGVTNAALDILSAAVNAPYVRRKGSNAPSQPIRMGLLNILNASTDGPAQDEYHLMETPKVDPAVWAMLQNSAAQEESATGANELLVQGSMPSQGRTSMGRTATGAGNMQSASSSRLQGPLDGFVYQVFVPFLYHMDQLVRDRMPVEQIRDILGDELGEEFLQEFDHNEFRNARMEYKVLAGARLSAKRAMAQSLPMMFSLFGQPAVTEDLTRQGKKIDWGLLVRRFEEVSEWNDPESLIIDMTPQEKQAAQMANPAMAKVQGQMALNNQTFQQKQQLNEQENYARAANQVLRVIAERNMEAGPSGSEGKQDVFSDNQ